jgi:NADH:ubiquinone oxidoreductase subunit F (NADH-binding)
MTVKQRAAVQTLAVLAAIIAGSVTMNLILMQFTAAEIVNGLAIASVAFLIYSMYGVILSRLEYQETAKQLLDKSGK